MRRHSTSHSDQPNTGVSRHGRRLRRPLIRLLLLLLGLMFGVAAFLALDWIHTTPILRSLESTGENGNCRISDPVRHHALKANCASVGHWGSNSYQFFTNSLGFRDEKIREVAPVADRPRILVLGDSFTEGKIAWSDSYVGRVAARFPEYEFLNGAVDSYSPSNYLNVVRALIAKGIQFDEVIVFIDISDVQDEAAFYRDADRSGAVTGPNTTSWKISGYAKWRWFMARHFSLTNQIIEFFEGRAIGKGRYHLTTVYGDTFDLERSAWTYRQVDETNPYITGYAPLGVAGGIAKEQAKMTQLWQELQARNIPLSVVVYPWPAQLVHDTVDSRQERIWRDWCQGKCKRFISLFPAFFAIKDSCPKSQPGCWYLSHFILGDVHYNATGNALVADGVIRSLLETPPVTRRLQAPDGS